MARLNYNQASKRYDQARAVPLQHLAEWKEKLNSYLGSPDLSVLDLGAGTGLFAEAFVEWFGVKVVAVEPSSGMIDKAIRMRSNALISYVVGSAEHIPVLDRHFDVAWLSTVIHHFPDLSAAALEINRILKPNAPMLIRSCFPERSAGVVLFRFFPEAQEVLLQFPTLDQTENVFSSAGFCLESATEVPQITASSMEEYRNRFLDDIRQSDTTLSHLSDADYSRGLARLERAVRHSSNGQPVIDRITLAVFRKIRSVI